MNYGIKSSGNGDLQALANRAGAKITSAIQDASAKTGVGFSYLLQQANVESSFNANAKAKTSSATGLYQFIESTWLSMVKEHGDKYGLGDYADKISNNGRVASRADRNQILALRKDPEIASAMAAEYAAENKSYLESKVNCEVGSTELYMAHFMGPGGAAKFLSKLQQNPNASAASAFPSEACSNKSVFYNSNGKPRTMSEVYAFFDRKFQGGDDGAVMTASASKTRQSSASNFASLGSNAKAALASAKFSSGRANIFDEKTGSWFTTSDPKTVKWASLQTNNKGGIPGIQGLLANPVDVLQVMEMASLHNDDNRYNS